MAFFCAECGRSYSAPFFDDSRASICVNCAIKARRPASKVVVNARQGDESTPTGGYDLIAGVRSPDRQPSLVRRRTLFQRHEPSKPYISIGGKKITDPDEILAMLQEGSGPRASTELPPPFSLQPHEWVAIIASLLLLLMSALPLLVMIRSFNISYPNLVMVWSRPLVFGASVAAVLVVAAFSLRIWNRQPDAPPQTNPQGGPDIGR